MKDKEFVEYVVGALVDHPDDVKVSRTTDDLGVLIELTVNREDMGKVIGKEGRTAKSIRTLLRVLGAKSDERVNMKIIEPEGGQEVAVPAENGEEKGKLEEQEETTVETEAPVGEETPVEAEAPAEEASVEEAPAEEEEATSKSRRDPDLDEKSPLDEIQI